MSKMYLALLFIVAELVVYFYTSAIQVSRDQIVIKDAESMAKSLSLMLSNEYAFSKKCKTKECADVFKNGVGAITHAQKIMRIGIIGRDSGLEFTTSNSDKPIRLSKKDFDSGKTISFFDNVRDPFSRKVIVSTYVPIISEKGTVDSFVAMSFDESDLYSSLCAMKNLFSIIALIGSAAMFTGFYVFFKNLLASKLAEVSKLETSGVNGNALI